MNIKYLLIYLIYCKIYDMSLMFCEFWEKDFFGYNLGYYVCLLIEIGVLLMNIKFFYVENNFMWKKFLINLKLFYLFENIYV